MNRMVGIDVIGNGYSDEVRECETCSSKKY